METCVLIPAELALVLRARPRRLEPPNPPWPRAPLPEMGVVVWASESLLPGHTLSADEGEMRLDKLEVYHKLPSNNVRFEFGCQDELLVVDGAEVRHCNWIRFVHSSTNVDEVNVVASRIKGRPIFQVVKDIEPNEELVVLFDTSEDGGRDEPAADTKTNIITHSFSDDFTVLSASEDGDDDVPTEDEKPRGEELMTSESDAALTSGSSRESSPQQPQSTSKEQQQRQKPVTPESASPLSSGQGTPACDRYPSVWTGFSPATGTPAPGTPQRFTHDLQMQVCAVQQAPLRRKEKTWLPCEVCGKKFDRPSLLKRHMRTHTGEKPHACDVCGKAFSTSSSLNTHRRIHSGEKPHQCQICGKRFTASSNLYYHRMTHKKEKPHKCGLCSKSFPTPGDLKSHMYVHNGSWPYKCHLCNRGFSKQTNLRNHMLLHTGDKPHECPYCQKKFALQCNLKTHLKTHEDSQEQCTECGRVENKEHLSSAGWCSACLEKKYSHPDISQPAKPRKPAFSVDTLVSPEHYSVDELTRNKLGASIAGSPPEMPHSFTGSSPEIPKPAFYGSAMMSRSLPFPSSLLGRGGYGPGVVGVPWPSTPSIAARHFGVP